MQEGQSLVEVLSTRKSEILTRWLLLQREAHAGRSSVVNESKTRQQSIDFLDSLGDAVRSGNVNTPSGSAWQDVRDLLARVSRDRALEGATPAETATFVFSLKQPLFEVLRRSPDGRRRRT